MTGDGEGKGVAGALAVAVLLFLAAAGATSCQPVEADRLYTVFLQSPPDRDNWKAAVPLLLRAGGGNVTGRNERLEELKRDTDPVHRGSASCHHGPPITNPVLLEARGYYTDRELHLEITWDDPTENTESRRWLKENGSWRLSDGDEDGIAVLWSRVAGSFGCQEACHMKDFTLRQGELVDQRGMFMAEEGEWEEAWVWKPSQGPRALLLERDGFRTIRDAEPYRTLNSAAAGDLSLVPEARRAGTFAAGDSPVSDGDGNPLRETVTAAPAYLYGDDTDGGGLRARAERRGGGWRVVFTRALDEGERRQLFQPGGSYRFGVAVFDGTSTNHHIVRDTQIMEVKPSSAPPAPPRTEGSGQAQEGSGIL